MKKVANSKNLYKITSLQAWSRLTDRYFNRKLRVEERKDREHIYTLLKELELPYEDFRTFKNPNKLDFLEFGNTIKQLGFPYWLSATPKVGITDLDRLSKLRIDSIKDGWEFIDSLPRLSDYKVIAMQYADNPDFKGSALVSKNLNGIADFVLGDRHVQLIEGLTISDPMLFNKDGIIHFSSIIPKKFQKELWFFIANHKGHFEFQYGVINGKKYLSFFDYNDEPAYEDIDHLHLDLVDYYSLNGLKESDAIVTGLPASLGRAYGRVRNILSGDYNETTDFDEGDILITDATNPSMTPLMKRSAAIVTDLGGVTSHAAIVCREMKIPCIVGTKDATHKIKEGSFVLVDACEGVVKVEGK